MWLWRSAVGFVERHKKAVMLGAVAGVGTVFALRKMKGAAEDMMEGMQKQALEEMQQFERTQRIEGHLTRTRSECQRNIQNFMPMIHKRLLDQLGLDAARKEAARKGATRDEKLVAWEEIKVLTLTRLFAGAYALAAQSMVLRVQLHISQRHQYERICVRGDAAGGTPGAGDGAGGERQGQAAAEIAHGFLMVSVEHLLGSGKTAAAAGAAAAGAAAAAPTGLEQLVELVRAAVEQETKSWTIAGKLQVKAEDLRALFDAIRARLGAASVQQCLLWPEGGGASSELQQLLDEARDMLESPHFLTALEESANAALGCVCKSALEASFSERAADSKPLAKLLSPVDKTFSRLFADFGGGRLGRATGLDTQLQSAALNALETPAVVAFCDAIFRSVGDESASSSA